MGTWKARVIGRGRKPGPSAEQGSHIRTVAPGTPAHILSTRSSYQRRKGKSRGNSGTGCGLTLSEGDGPGRHRQSWPYDTVPGERVTRGPEASGLRHNDKGEGNNLPDEPKIPLVSSEDRRTDLPTGKGNQAIVHQAEARAEVKSVVPFQDPEDRARPPSGGTICPV